MKPADLAYIAGIVDGEGYVGIAKRMPGKNKMRSPKYSSRLSIAMCEPIAIQFIAQTFGITRNMNARPKRNIKHRPCLQMNLEHNQAADVLASILPYLKIKRQQAELAVSLRMEQTRGSKKTRTTASMRMSRHIRVGATPVSTLSDEHLAQCEVLYLKCKQLNKRGAR